MSTPNDTPKTIEIPLTEHYSVYVDIADADLALMHWSYKRGGYAYKGIDGKVQALHRIVLERIMERPLETGEQCDHKDGDSSNNRRDNLRLTNSTGNNRNARMRKDNTSGFKGIWKVGNRWRACIKVNGKKIYLGFFDTPEEAYKAYCDAAIKYHGEFARLK